MCIFKVAAATQLVALTARAQHSAWSMSPARSAWYAYKTPVDIGPDQEEETDAPLLGGKVQSAPVRYLFL
jgi:hypothetical protein